MLKRLLVGFLVIVALWLVPCVGYGEIQHWLYESEASNMTVQLLKARIGYMMHNPTNFLDVDFYYDVTGRIGAIDKLPGNVNTQGKILVDIRDNRNLFSYESGIALQNQFEKQLTVIYSFLVSISIGDMDADVVAVFYSREGIRLGYFYRGLYHLS